MIRCVVACFAVWIFACSSHTAIAGYIMHVHFGDPTEADNINSASEILTAPIGATIGSDVTANFLLEITGDSTLYFYRFSARFNTQKLGYVSRESTRPAGWEIAVGVDPGEPSPVPQSAYETIAGPFEELRRFNGVSPAGSNADIGSGFHRLGSVTYTLLSTPLSGELLIQPGRFELDNSGQIELDALVDQFLTDVDGDPNATVEFRQGIVAVPEPSSLLLLSLGASGMVGFRSLRTRRLRRRELLGVK